MLYSQPRTITFQLSLCNSLLRHPQTNKQTDEAARRRPKQPMTLWSRDPSCKILDEPPAPSPLSPYSTLCAILFAYPVPLPCSLFSISSHM